MTKPVISQFNQLATLLVQQYERYLPTAFDESLSLLEKVNKIIQYLNETGQLVNSVVEQWNTVFDWVMNDGLDESVNDKIDEMYADGSLDTALQRVFGDLEQRLEDGVNALESVHDFTLYPQSPKPQKSGRKTCSPKIIHKTSDNVLRVFQKTNKGYVQYKLQKNDGASQPDRDYGSNHELIRIVEVSQMQDVYVYKDVKTPLTGTLTVSSGEGMLNSVEDLLFNLPQHDSTKTLSSKSGNIGMGVYTLAPATEVTYELNVTKSKKANLLIQTSAASNTDLQIFVNDVLVKTVNPRALTVEGASPNSAAVIEFEVPSKSVTQDKVSIKIRANNASGNAYICALNFFTLKDWRNQDIDNYKAFGSSKTPWIDNSGASDYAIYDADLGKWFGSYHGGEISEYDRILWGSQITQEDDNNLSLYVFSTIPAGDWRVQEQFYMYQQTSLANNKAKMVSEFNFDTDGTIEMDFSYYNGTVNVSTFYTALTCGSVAFNYLFSPQFVNYGTVPTNGFFSYPLSEGRISQVNSTDAMQLDIRFTKFNNAFDTRGATIADNDAYRKFYYGPVYGKSKVVSNVTFSKGLDFIVR